MADRASPSSHPLFPELLAFFALPLGGALFNLARSGEPTDPIALAFEIGGGLVLGGFYVLVHGFLWFFTGSHMLGFRPGPRESIGRVGGALMQPGLASLVVGVLFFGGAVLAGAPAPLSAGLSRLFGLWAIVSVVLTFKRTFAASGAKVALFVLWLLLLALSGVLLFRTVRGIIGV